MLVARLKLTTPLLTPVMASHHWSLVGAKDSEKNTLWHRELGVEAGGWGNTRVGVVARTLEQSFAELGHAVKIAIAMFPRDGRTADRLMGNAGRSLRQNHLKAHQWFAAGETVQLVAQGPGFSVAGSGQALTAGIEGQPVRIRTESGRILTAEAVGERRAEVNP